MSPKGENSILNAAYQSRDLNKDALKEMLRDEQKRIIFMAVKNQPMVTREIMKRTKLAQTSAYRKIRWLLENGILQGTRIRGRREFESDKVLLSTIIKEIHFDWMANTIEGDY